MTDLFGDNITSPQCAASILKLSTRNAAEGFVEFWSAWPSGPRKVAKQQCLDKWARHECAVCWSLIVAHVEWLKTQDDWLRGFIPQPQTYLNQRRWADWTPPAPKVTKPDALAILKAHKGVPPSPATRKKLAELKAAR